MTIDRTARKGAKVGFLRLAQTY